MSDICQCFELELSKIANSTELSLIDLVKVKNEVLHYLTLDIGSNIFTAIWNSSLASTIRFPIVVFWDWRVLEVGHIKIDEF